MKNVNINVRTLNESMALFDVWLCVCVCMFFHCSKDTTCVFSIYGWKNENSCSFLTYLLFGDVLSDESGKKLPKPTHIASQKDKISGVERLSLKIGSFLRFFQNMAIKWPHICSKHDDFGRWPFSTTWAIQMMVKSYDDGQTLVEIAKSCC